MNKKPAPPPSVEAWDPMDPVASAERRRVGRIVRDDRGQAVVEWVKAPKDWARANLSLVEDAATPVPGTGSAPLKGYDPYESGSAATGTWNTRASQLTRPARTDLRRLSEHIKQMRALKDRQSNGE